MNRSWKKQRDVISLAAALNAAVVVLGGLIIPVGSTAAAPLERVSDNGKHVLIAANNDAASKEAAIAVQLYNQKAYGPATDAFERILRTAAPEPNLYYYAALANLGSKHAVRAQQLFQYIVTNFPHSVQANYAKTAMLSQHFGDHASSSVPEAPASSEVVELPESIKATLSPEMQAMLKTPEGQQAVKDALQKNATKIQALKSGGAVVASRSSDPATSVATVCDNKGPGQVRILL